MPDGQVVGRVAIKILPETSKFKQEAEAELKKAEQGLEVKAKVVLDADDIKAQAEKIQAAAKNALKDIGLRVNLDNEDSVRAGIARLQAELNRLAETSIHVDLNGDDLGAALDLLNDRLDEIRTIRLTVDESSQDSIKAAIARIDAELAKLRSVDIDVHVNEAELLAVREMLANDLRLDLTVDYDDDASLKQALAKINAELAKIAEVNLTVGMDEESLKKAQEELRKRLDLRAEVALNWDMAEAQATADKVKAMLDDIKVNPKLDDRDVAKLKRQLEAAFLQMEELKAKITPELDAVAKRKVEHEIDDLQDKIDGLKAEIEPETSKSAIAAVMASMARLTRDRTVNLFPKVSVSAYTTAASMLKALSGGRVLSQTFEKLGNVLKNLDRSTPIIGTLATAIAGLASWGIAAASNLAALSASLAQIGATSLALPGILGGMAIGVGATIAAFKDFNKVLPEVKGQLSALQDLISSNFWAEAKKPIRDLIDSALPALRDGFAQTSTQLGQFFGGFATALKGSLAPELKGMFGDLSKSIDIATSGTGAFANVITTLGKVGAGYLPQLAQWFVDIAEKASNWLNQKGESGLKEEIDAGIQSLKDLGGVLFETGGILAGIARAATEAGGSTLGMLRDTLAGIHAAVDSSGAQQALVGVFTAAHQAMSNMAGQGGAQVKRFFSELASLITEVMPQVGTIIGTAIGGIADALSQPMVTLGVQDLFNGLEQGVNALVPALKPLGAALGAVLSIMGEMAENLGPLLAAALTPLANAFVSLTPAILPLIDLLGGALTGVFRQLAPVINQLAPVIADVLGQAFTALSQILPIVAQAFGQMLAAVAPLVLQLISGLAPILPLVAQFIGQIITAAMPLVDVLIQILSAILIPLIPVVQGIAETFLPLFAQAFDRLVQAVMPFLEALKSIIDFLMPVLAPAIEFLAELFLGTFVSAINGVALVFEGLKEIFKGVIDYLKAVFEFWYDFFTLNWGDLWDDAVNVFKSLMGILKGLWDTLLGAFITWLSVSFLGAAKKGLTAIKDAFKAGWDAVVNFGKSAWSNITSGFSSFFSGLWSKASSGISRIKSFFSDGWDSVRTTAISKFQSLVSTIETWIGKAASTVAKLPGKAKEALGDLSSTLKNAGIQLIKGFISGISGMFGAVKDKLGSLTDKLTSWKGPESLDKVILVNAGQLVINGFIAGLESRYDAVRKSLKGLTEDVAGTEFGAPSIGAFSTSRGVSSAVSAALAGQAGGTTKVLNYYAAPGSSIDSEEDLFAAANRARMGW
ncbi:hypothetical protein NX794_07615 [Streptomyces sp. LP11]|uniref:Tape measure protein n=1 Tax=Streptomyces pyxinicus TaxID=2970331 RepID=A0ABT2AZI6_9ACTN|nr:hypothetical protein [Streptomyces sp. LP11]MCS0601098.1 hypothetical protein [Streptomyces sp. LP11]